MTSCDSKLTRTKHLKCHARWHFQSRKQNRNRSNVQRHNRNKIIWHYIDTSHSEHIVSVSRLLCVYARVCVYFDRQLISTFHNLAINIFSPNSIPLNHFSSHCYKHSISNKRSNQNSMQSGCYNFHWQVVRNDQAVVVSMSSFYLLYKSKHFQYAIQIRNETAITTLRQAHLNRSHPYNSIPHSPTHNTVHCMIIVITIVVALRSVHVVSMQTVGDTQFCR